MYDNVGEIIYIMNLLLENDGKEPIKKSELFDAEDNLIPGAEQKIKELTKEEEFEKYIALNKNRNET